MAKLAFHCQNYKAGALTGIDGHNRRLHSNHISNPDIRTEDAHLNRIYIAPKKGLHADCKEKITNLVIGSGHRVRKDSNWICECIVHYPEGLPLERLDEFNELIIDYFGSRLGKNNIVEAVAHLDEGGRPHLHVDIVLITEDKKLSSKELITRDFIMSVHDKLPELLCEYGFDVERGEAGQEGGLSAKAYKKKMEQEAKEIQKQVDEMKKEYNNLVDSYNNLIDERNELKNRNMQKAQELVNSKHRER